VLELLFVLLVGAAAAVAVLVWIASVTSWAFLLVVIAVLAVAGLVGALALFRLATRYWSSAYGYRPVDGAQHATVRTPDGAVLNVELDGSRGAPLTVVFLHGVASDLSVWHHQREALAETPHRAITFDARGHGKSSYVALAGSTVGVRQLAEDVGTVIDELAPAGPLVLVGHSMGGMSIFALADVRPDIIARTRSLVILNSTPGPFGPSVTLGLPKLFAPVYLLARRYAVATFWLASRVPERLRHAFGLGPYLIGMRAMAAYGNQPREAVRIAALGLWHTPARVLADCARAIMSHDEQAALTTLPLMPVVVLAGHNDRIITPAEVHRWAPTVPHVRLVILERCGHMTPLEQPDEVNAQLLAIVDETARHLAARRPEPAAEAAPRPRPRPRPST